MQLQAVGPCDSSGAFTDRLCDGDSLSPSSYLVSPNGNYRFYYQSDNAGVVYDTTQSPWVAVHVIFGSDTSFSAGEMVYGATSYVNERYSLGYL